MLAELKRRLRLFFRQLNFGNRSSGGDVDHQLYVGESAHDGYDGASHHF